MHPQPTTIGPLEAADVEAAAALLARAMSSNPMHVAVFGRRDDDVERRQAQMFSVVLREFPGRRLTAKHGARLVGVLRMVRSPLCRLPPGEAARLRPRLLEILGGCAPRVAEWFSVWSERDPAAPHWHLGPVAVTEELQGRGIGSALLQRFCEHVDAAGEPAYLETDLRDNVRLYERFGFRVREEIEIFGVSNHFMWRAAR